MLLVKKCCAHLICLYDIGVKVNWTVVVGTMLQKPPKNFHNVASMLMSVNTSVAQFELKPALIYYLATLATLGSGQQTVNTILTYCHLIK